MTGSDVGVVCEEDVLLVVLLLAAGVALELACRQLTEQ